MTPKNELEKLLLSSLEQISQESQAQRQEISAEYTACMQTFKELSETVIGQYELVLPRLKVLEEHYEEVMRLLQTLNATLDSSPSAPNRSGGGYTGGVQ